VYTAQEVAGSRQERHTEYERLRQGSALRLAVCSWRYSDAQVRQHLSRPRPAPAASPEV